MKRILILAAATLAAHHSFAQRVTAEFEDGTTMEYEILSSSPDNLAPITLSFGSTQGNVRDGMKVDYFNEDLGIFQLRLPSLLTLVDNSVSPSLRASGLFFLNSSSKTTMKPITLMSTQSGDVVTKYRTETPIDRKSRFGVHGGLGYRDTRYSPFGTDELVTYAELMAGVGMFRSQHISIMREVNGAAYRAQGTASMQLTADAVLFLGTERADATDASPIESESLGFEVAWVGRSSFWGKRDWGIWLTAGYGVGPVGSYPVLGGGLFFGYGNKL